MGEGLREGAGNRSQRVMILRTQMGAIRLLRWSSNDALPASVQEGCNNTPSLGSVCEKYPRQWEWLLSANHKDNAHHLETMSA